MLKKPWFLREKILFDCNKCGECCHDMDNPLSHYDIKRITSKDIYIKEFIDLVPCEASEPYAVLLYGESVQLFLKNKETDNSCIFLENDICSIYDARPNSCRTWPFSINNKILTIDDYAYKVTDVFCDKKRFKDHNKIEALIMEGINETKEYKILIEKWNKLVEKNEDLQTLEGFFKYMCRD
ncbi:MAG: YkgJ family cysteine cluster protein [Candidatus Sericytochromatia bacterium]